MVGDGAVSALILFLVIGLLPFFVREFRNNTHLMLAYWFVVTLHQVVAFVNAFFFATLGATQDAQTSHKGGLILASFLKNHDIDWNIFLFSSTLPPNVCKGLQCDVNNNFWGFFEQFLGLMYFLFGSFFGNFFNST